MAETSRTTYLSKDFIETAEGLIFAVVAPGTEQDKVLCFLRYVKAADGCKKKATEEANELLRMHYPEYLHYSTVLDTSLHAVAVNRIVKHHQPRQGLQLILRANRQDVVERDLVSLCSQFEQRGMNIAEAGVTGSLLICAQKADSDIDLIWYDRSLFHQCRAAVKDLIEQDFLQSLQANDWQDSYARRSCDLSLSEYVWHERRKYNKALVNGRKFDLNFIDLSADVASVSYRKRGFMTLQCQVVDDSRAFDYPAEYKIAHEQIKSVVSFTATYTGQAFTGEMIEVCGLLEHSEHGDMRIVVGATREAHGEYIKVMHD
ncbi:MAG: hypothetical protein HOP23_00125 [Methylococcaceae bacterium]|nr:hypothetical protein [Methylococcaceae bacterium]